MAAYKGHRMNPDKFEKGQIKIYLFVVPLVLITGLPIVFIIFHAFKPMEELFAFPPKFITTHPTLDNFRKLFKASRSAGIPLSKYVFNSMLITVTTVAASLFFSTAAAYALSKLKFKGRRAMLQINQFALMFVPVAVMIPRYLVVNKLGLIDSYWAEILPLIPPDLPENYSADDQACHCDGCNPCIPAGMDESGGGELLYQRRWLKVTCVLYEYIDKYHDNQYRSRSGYFGGSLADHVPAEPDPLLYPAEERHEHDGTFRYQVGG